MTSFKYFVTASLDGLIADREGLSLWSSEPEVEEQVADTYRAFAQGIGAVVIGGKAYAGIAREVAEGSRSWPFGRLPVWVFTHHELPTVAVADLTFIRGSESFWHDDIASSAGAKDVWVFGGSDIAGALLDAGVLDEIWVLTYPVLLGSGHPLIGRNVKARVRLLEAEQLSHGMRLAGYSIERA
ncbi:dihydrofolate reductase family protein [Glutamicibacter endophyticus]|uniref:dihydrofolate reductase family protein n=1 Tax=Glutamicibacter endophyticus TaxID=1522174 RepID=UPI003AF0E785